MTKFFGKNGSPLQESYRPDDRESAPKQSTLRAIHQPGVDADQPFRRIGPHLSVSPRRKERVTTSRRWASICNVNPFNLGRSTGSDNLEGVDSENFRPDRVGKTFWPS